MALTAKRYPEATQQLAMAHTLERNNYTLESLAYAHLMSGDLETARATYEQLIEDRDLGWEAQEYWILGHYELGRIYEQLADTARAIDYYSRFLSIWKDGDDELSIIDEARRRIQGLLGHG